MHNITHCQGGTMTLTDIKREQANAATTLTDIGDFVEKTGRILSPAAIRFLTGEAERAYNQYLQCAKALWPSKDLSMWDSKVAAKQHVDHLLNNSKNEA